MPDASTFLHPTAEWQRRYEALRASFVDRLPARVVGERFGYAPGYVHLLRHLFRHGHIDFAEVPPAGRRARVPTAVRTKICAWRGQHLSAGEIAQLLDDEGTEISVRTVERHRENIMSKLNLHTRAELVRYAMQREIVATPLS